MAAPLPLSLPTLEFAPKDVAARYVRHIDGTFKLTYIDEADAASYLDAIRTGALQVIPHGETLASMAATAKEAAEAQQAVMDEMVRLTKANVAKANARIEAGRAAILARHGYR